LDIGVLGYIGIVQHKEHSPEVLSIPPGTPCIGYMFRLVLNDGKNSFIFDYTTGMSRLQLNKCKGKGKGVPLQPWTGPEGSRRLRLPYFKTIGT